MVWRTSCRVPRRSHELSKVVPWYIMGLLTMLPDDTPRAKLTAVGQLTGVLTKNKRVDMEGGERYNTGTEYKRAESDCNY